MKRNAFTLIELLIVIAIIGVLVGVGAPALINAMLTGQRTAAMSQARQIGVGLRTYAVDHDGLFPESEDEEEPSNANEVYRRLIPHYIDQERTFAVSRSVVGAKADGKMDGESCLAAGENHFAYVTGCTSSSSSYWPLVVDSTDGSGFYTTDESKRGGTWKGLKAIVISVDGSASAFSLKGSDEKRYVPRADDASKNALQVGDYMREGSRLLEPESKGQ